MPALMPGKSMCPKCSQKYRSAAHLCHPNSVRAHTKWLAAREPAPKK